MLVTWQLKVLEKHLWEKTTLKIERCGEKKHGEKTKTSQFFQHFKKVGLKLPLGLAKDDKKMAHLKRQTLSISMSFSSYRKSNMGDPMEIKSVLKLNGCNSINTGDVGNEAITRVETIITQDTKPRFFFILFLSPIPAKLSCFRWNLSEPMKTANCLHPYPLIRPAFLKRKKS